MCITHTLDGTEALSPPEGKPPVGGTLVGGQMLGWWGGSRLSSGLQTWSLTRMPRASRALRWAAPRGPAEEATPVPMIALTQGDDPVEQG